MVGISVKGVREVKITGAQVRAARAFLDWTIARLAKEASVGISTVQAVEKFNGEPRVVPTLQWRSDARDEAVAKIVDALEAAGITFLPERGGSVGLRGRVKS
jgi:predicted transcriptional regulator